MATSPMVGAADPAILKSLETQTPSVARTAPATVNASTGTATSSGSSVSRGITPQVSGGTVTYNQATQLTAGNTVSVTSSTSNDPGDVVTIYTSPKAVSVSAINQTVNTYKVNNYTGNEYTDSNVAAYLPTYTGNVGAGNVNVTDTVYASDLSATGLASLTLLNVSTTANLGAVGNVIITGGTNGQVLTTNGSNVLSWTTVSGGNGSYSNSNVAAYLPTYTGNVGANVVTANLFSGNGSSLTNLPITEDTTGVDKFVLISDGNLKYSGRVTITPDTGNIATLGKINSGNIIANGNVTANFLIGNGSSLTALAGANVTGTVGNANLSQYLNVSDVNNNFSYHVVLSAGSGDKSLHIDADDNLQYNPVDGTLTSVRVDATYVLANLNFANGYLASNVVGLGNIATANLNGNGSQVLAGNGAWIAAGGGGSSALISNGTSYANVVASDGNVVISVDNDVASWTFATDGNIYAKSETDLTLVVADPNGDGYAVKQSLTDGTTELSRTSLQDGQFSIYTNLDGAGEEWRFEGNTLQVSNDSTIKGFASNVTIQAMSSGGTDVASLQSVSNTNDPNIFSTFDATPTGANIKVYNGGSNSGVGYTWQYGNDGRLTFPGTPRIDTGANNFEVQAAENINFEANTVVNIYTDTGNTTYQWQFGDDGNLTLPANTFAVNYANGTQVSLAGTYGNSNVVSLLGSFGSNTISTTGNVAVGAVSASGKIGYASGSTVTQTTNRGNGVTINALAGTIVTTSVVMQVNEIDSFSVINSSVDINNDIVVAQIVSPNQGTYNCIANPALIGGFSNGFYINIVNISGFVTSDETITIRFMVLKAPNA